MALAQIRNEKRLRSFQIEISDNDGHIANATDPNAITNLKEPFSGYKWIVFTYQLCFTMNGAICFFFYYILIGYTIDKTMVIPWWDGQSNLYHWTEVLLNTLPFLAMCLEYPCNQIPFDWKMLPFDIAITVIYGIFNFFICLFDTVDNTPIYNQLDWFANPAKAFLNFFLILIV